MGMPLLKLKFQPDDKAREKVKNSLDITIYPKGEHESLICWQSIPIQ